MKTTLNKIRDESPCAYGWKKLLAHLGKTQADDEPLSIITILDSNGLDDALWCLRAVENHDREIRLYAVWCARQVQHLMTDKRSLEALDVAERFANGLATADDLAAASDAAKDAVAAVGAAVWRAAGAAWAASAASDAAKDAVAAVGAAVDAAWAAVDAAWAAAGFAARAAAKDAVAAVGAAARAAEREAAWSAVWSAVWYASRDAQEKRLREVCAAINAAIAQAV